MKISKKFLQDELKKRTSQGFLKLKTYFEEIIKSEKFQQKIQELRNRYSIPRNGFTLNREEYKKYSIFSIPDKWMYKNNRTKLNEIEKEVSKLVETYDLYELEWFLVFWHYLIYNKILILDQNFPPPLFLYDFDLCLIRDELEWNNLLNNSQYNPDTIKEIINGELKNFPIAIKISPYATERDILDFIKKNFKQIKSLQKKYQNPNIKIGKLRQKNVQIQKRNEFIWKHRNLPRKKIMYLASAKFKGQVLGYAEVEKIIVLEDKRRKEL